MGSLDIPLGTLPTLRIFSKMPIVSILVPLFNRAQLVAASIKSAMSQTFTDIEIIVVDNQSSDASYDIVAELASEDPRIKLHRNDQNIGPVRNWIRCAELASAPYSKLLFSDDLIAPSYLEKTLPFILSPEVPLYILLLSSVNRNGMGK